MKDFNKDAEMLNRELTEIDVGFIEEAVSYKKKKSIAPLLGAVSAACLLLVTVPMLMKGALDREKPLSDPAYIASVEYGEPEMLDGRAKLILREKDGEICYINLTRDQLMSLVSALDKGTAPPDEDDEGRVWIQGEDGLVYTPELYLSSGNVGYGCLFDYVPERAAGEEFTSLMNGILYGEE